MPHFHRTVLLASNNLRLARVSCDGDDGPHPVEEHADDHNVVLALRGRFTFRDRLTRAVVSPSRGLVLTAGQTYTISHPHCDGDVCLSVAGSFLSHLVEGQRTTSALSVAGYTAVQRLVARLTAGEPVDQLAIEEALCLTLSQHESRHPAQKHDRAIAEAITHAVELRFDERLPLNHLAFVAGVSVFHACRAFRRVMGTSIHRYHQEIRLRHALALLLDTQLPLAQIAGEAGFANQGHLSNAFRRRFGRTLRRARMDRAEEFEVS
jgi:AraC family transcriptional regulator